MTSTVFETVNEFETSSQAIRECFLLSEARDFLSLEDKLSGIWKKSLDSSEKLIKSTFKVYNELIDESKHIAESSSNSEFFEEVKHRAVSCVDNIQSLTELVEQTQAPVLELNSLLFKNYNELETLSEKEETKLRAAMKWNIWSAVSSSVVNEKFNYLKLLKTEKSTEEIATVATGCFENLKTTIGTLKTSLNPTETLGEWSEDTQAYTRKEPSHKIVSIWDEESTAIDKINVGLGNIKGWDQLDTPEVLLENCFEDIHQISELVA